MQRNPERADFADLFLTVQCGRISPCGCCRFGTTTLRLTFKPKRFKMLDQVGEVSVAQLAGGIFIKLLSENPAIGFIIQAKLFLGDVHLAHLTFADPQQALKIGLDLAAVARRMIERREAEAHAQAEG